MTSPLFYFLLPFFFPHILSLDLCFVKRRGFIFEMNVHGCGLIPLSYELALFITELGSGGDESINWRGSFFFLSLFLYIYILHPNWKDMKEIKGDCCNREFPHDHSAAAAAAHLWMRIMTNYGLVKEKRGEEKFLQILTESWKEEEKKTSYKEVWRWQDLTSLCIHPHLHSEPPQPPSEEGEMACSSQQIHLPKKSRNLFGKEKLFIPPKEKKKKNIWKFSCAFWPKSPPVP